MKPQENLVEQAEEPQENLVELAEEHLLASPARHLFAGLIGNGTLAFTAFLAEGVACWFLQRQRFTTAEGDVNASNFEIAVVCVVTLACYYIAGEAWKRSERRIAAAAYGLAIFILTYVIWTWLDPSNKQIWDSFHGGESDGAVPWWFLLVMNVLTAGAFSTTGLVFVHAKSRFAGYAVKWPKHLASLRKIDQGKQADAADAYASAAEAWTKHVEGDFNNLVRQLHRMALDQETAAVDAARQELERRAADVRTGHSAKASAGAEAERLAAWLKAWSGITNGKNNGGGKPIGAALVLLALLLGTSTARAESEICRTAPSFQLLVDASTSSPVADPKFLKATEPHIMATLRSLPVCSRIMATTIGDARVMPDVFESKLLLRTVRGEGQSREDIARSLRGFLAAMPDHVRANGQPRSELIGALADASRLINHQAKSRNTIIILSDLAESSALARCEKGSCRLPPPSFTLAESVVDVEAYGVGMGLSSDKAMLLAKAWENFMAQAGQKDWRVRRIFK